MLPILCVPLPLTEIGPSQCGAIAAHHDSLLSEEAARALLEMGDAPEMPVNPHRCLRNLRCIRGHKHPGMCKLQPDGSKMIDRILGKAPPPLRAKGKEERPLFLVQVSPARS